MLALTATALVAVPSTASASAFSWTGKGDGTSWTDVLNWSPAQEPDKDDDVSITRLPGGPANVLLPGPKEVAHLTLGEGASLTGGSISALEGLSWGGGVLATSVTVGASGVSTIGGDTVKDLDGSLTLNGPMIADGPGVVRLFGSSSITNNGAFGARSGLLIQGMVCCTVPSRFVNNGVISVTPTVPLLPGRVQIASTALVQRGKIDVAGAARLELTIAPSSFEAGSSMTGLGRTVLANTSATATMTGTLTVGPGATFEVAGGTELGGTGSFTGGGTVLWSGGELRGVHTVQSSTRTTIAGTAVKRLATGFGGGQLTLAGPTTAAATGAVQLAGPATLTNTGTFTATGGLQIQGTVCCSHPAVFANKGTLVARPGAGNLVYLPGAKVLNTGQVRVENGTLQAQTAGYQQTAGKTVLAGGVLASDKTVDIAGGTLAGIGTVRGPLANGGVLVPGAATPAGSTGFLDVTGSYTQRSTGTLRIDVKGTTAGTSHDQLRVAGAATFGGTLALTNASAFAPASTARLPVVKSATRTGSFAAVWGATLPGTRRYWVSYVPSGATLRVMQAFAGSTETASGGDRIPADTSVAVTATHVLETNNSALRLTNTTGAVPQGRSLAAFFHAPAAGGDVFDPKVALDRMGPDQRVYVMALQEAGTTDATGFSRIHLAVSRSSDPATLDDTGWCRYAIDGKRNPGTLDSSWADYPGLGFGADALILTTSQHRFNDDSRTYSVLRALDKLTLAHNTTTTCAALPKVHSFQASPTRDDPAAHILMPVQHQTQPTSFAGSGNPAYAVSAVRGTSQDYRLWRLRNMAGGAPTLDNVSVHAPAGYSLPPDAAQRGGTPLLDTSDTRITSAMGQGDAVTVAHNSGCNVGGGAPESCIRLLRLTVGQGASGGPTGTVTRLSTLQGSAGDFLFHPGVAVTAAGVTGVVFLRSSATTYLGAAWTLQSPTTAAEPLQTLASGNCHSASDRAGDFSGAALNPAGSSIWLATEHFGSAAGSCEWQTTVAEIRP